jgi:hypothetical protein
LRKLTGEVSELAENPSDRSEWSDVLLCYLMAACAKGYSAQDLIQGARLKLAICERQEFVPVGDGTFKRVKTAALEGLTNLADAMAEDIMSMSDAEILAEAAEDATAPSQICSDCPPVGHSTDRTRCLPCPRRTPAPTGEQKESTS